MRRPELQPISSENGYFGGVIDVRGSLSISFFLGVVVLAAEPVAQEIYRCKDGQGGITFTDVPCDGREIRNEEGGTSIEEQQRRNAEISEGKTGAAVASDEEGKRYPWDNRGHRELLDLPVRERTETLGRLLRASGTPCRPADSFYQGSDEENAVYWNVACRNGQAYSIQIADDAGGNTRILECSVMEMLGVECFKKFE